MIDEPVSVWDLPPDKPVIPTDHPDIAWYCAYGEWFHLFHEGETEDDYRYCESGEYAGHCGPVTLLQVASMGLMRLYDEARKDDE